MALNGFGGGLILPGVSPTKAPITDLAPKLAQQITSYAGTRADVIIITNCPQLGGMVDMASTMDPQTAINAMEAMLRQLRGGGYQTKI